MTDDLTRLDAYDYELPPELIAQQPLAERDQARLLVLDRRTQSLSHRQICDLPDLLQPGDCLVVNNTRVVPARLVGVRTRTGGRWEGLFLGLSADGWQLIGQTRGRLELGETVTIAAPQPQEPSLMLRLVSRGEGGVWLWEPEATDDPWMLLDRYGQIPLPPYIARPNPQETDRERYQTVFAKHAGSAAAPTAGLHFTPALLQRCADRGIDRVEVTLHVGLGTFRPVSVESITEHVMHAEACEVSAETAQCLAAVRARGGRIVAVGTTSLRTLETAARNDMRSGWSGESRLFIYPPYDFRLIDGLLTNFHLPKSTLLMLVSAFAGVDLTRVAYRTAVDEHYRFFSYGDAMLIL